MAPSTLTKSIDRKRKRDGAEGSGNTERRSEEENFKQKVLLLSSRGVSHRMRHLMADIGTLLPHSKKDAKLDSKHQLYMVNELADLSSCNNALFFEARRRNDIYLWAAKTPNGPSIRFHLLNTHTMDELKMTGNCLKGSRPIVVFDQAFDESAHLRIIKEVLMQIFAVPRTARKAKPFVDHITSFSIADGKIWFRSFQIIDSPAPSVIDPIQAAEEATAAAIAEGISTKSSRSKASGGPRMTLSEIGPRFVLVPIKIFEGSFGGATLYANKEFVPPSQVYTAQKNERALKYQTKKADTLQNKARREEIKEESRRTGRPEQLEKRSIFA
ncbi:uncharacterized protein L969DRAFT_87297 [Mixia osmundae IAM 14324]|uniref:Brix domain-containing protein n=1 Tax=Mixia osmundae (strain CBS 9802 / IAM 14324 / JCM 22182 / KY 12970) TaxID=764103 RepID=G7E3F1_MIXOS|nr:uncharacterized protein L969DRAFT_87297 [Mixia osmundae IAM 14324]KEI39347.1 hypothetical protein L969DRAFT_87297 [Mixia osmundae IAM 14324]GAA97361.1 hypothetical protein E5Q_04039 [Mixia osmundae IAM 14324]